MHLASDYIHPYKDAGGRPSHCRVRIYLPDDIRDAPVVICLGVPNNPGGSVTNSAEGIAAGVIRADELPTPLVWIEHWPKESTGRGEETFDLVIFTSNHVTERAPYLGETRMWIGDVTWKPLDRSTVQVLVDGRCRASSAGRLSIYPAATPSLKGGAVTNILPGQGVSLREVLALGLRRR